jgi:hypothetical protein
MKTLDFHLILARPIQARNLAEHGSDALMITVEHFPQIHKHIIDTSHGVRSAFIDLKTNEGR